MARDIYRIPHNFAEEGTVFNGKIRLRNALEAAFLGGILLLPLLHISLGIKAKIYIAIIVVLPVLILAVIGVMGESLFSFIFSFFLFMKNRRVAGSILNREEEYNDGRNQRTGRTAAARKRAGKKRRKRKED